MEVRACHGMCIKVMFPPPNGNSVSQAGQGCPGGSVIQLPGMIQYVPYGGFQLGSPGGNPPQQQPNLQARPLEKLLKVETKTLGAIQIMIGLTHIGLACILIAGRVNEPTYYFALGTYVGYPIWSGIFFIVSGSLSVLSEKRLSSSLVRCSVGLNITSAIAAIIGIIFYITELVISASYRHPPYNNYLYHSYSTWTLNVGIGILILLFSLLEFCITVSAAHFGCQAACCTRDTPMVFVPYTVNVARVTPSEGNLTIPSDNDVASPPETEAQY